MKTKRRCQKKLKIFTEFEHIENYSIPISTKFGCVKFWRLYTSIPNIKNSKTQNYRKTSHGYALKYILIILLAIVHVNIGRVLITYVRPRINNGPEKVWYLMVWNLEPKKGLNI